MQSRPAVSENPSGTVTWALGAVVALTIFRSFKPLSDRGHRRDRVDLLLELVFVLALVTLTGAWDSPLLFALAGTLGVVGFSYGVVGAVQYGAAAAAVVMATHLLLHPIEMLAPSSVLYWTCILVLTAGIPAYARVVATDARDDADSDDLARLADANSLLARLHSVALTLPASLDLEDVLDSSISRLRALVRTDGLAILTADPQGDGWTVQRRKAISVTKHTSHGDLPEPARAAANAGVVVLCADLAQSGPGFNTGSASAIYAPLIARGEVIGLLALERSASPPFNEAEAHVVEAYAEPVGLALDNARWFGRIQSVSAEAERSRIARDLHDRIGQALAYLAFELDGVMRKQQQGAELEQPLAGLRQDLRGVVAEVRETLYDLRTDIGDDKSFADTAEEFAERLAGRAGIEITLDLDNGERLPIVQEREMWRIAQEALTNVERHAHASHARVSWRCRPTRAELTVSDDGKGMPADKQARSDSFGILGMRERAATIGASLLFESHPGQGTTVTCSLNRQN